MRLRTVVAISIAGLLELLAVGMVMLAITNVQDEALSPAAQKMLQIPQPTVADASNGYFLLLGMQVPKETDPLEAGRRIQDGLDREFRENPMRTEYTQAKQSALDLSAWSKLHCPLKGEDCAGFYLKQKPALHEWINAQDLLLARYARLMSLTDFEERPWLSASLPLPSYSTAVSAAETNLVSAVFATEAGDAEGGLAILSREIAFHRRLLAGSRSMIWKMINVAMLRRDYQVLSDIIEHWPALAQTHAQPLNSMLRPLDLAETDMRQVLDRESLFAGRLLLTLRDELADASNAPDSDSGWLRQRAARVWNQWALLPNATLNSAALYWGKRAEAGTGSAATVDARKQQLAAYFASWSSDLIGAPWKYLRNPGGKIYLTSEEPNMYFSYIERVHDLDGYVHLVSLQSALRRENIGVGGIAAFIQRAGPEMRNPYNGQAMRWDSASSSLIFEGHQPSTANPAGESKLHRIKMAMH